ncbi:MAG: T9SS type B sorting domain-containing protein, partial [Cytophagales bacterium]|nr:T9SS type B sorting domain-containing protein [Cytophagales bacterium]
GKVQDNSTVSLRNHRVAGRYTYFYSIRDCRGPEAGVEVSFESLPLVRVELSDDSSPYVCTGEEVSHALGISSEEDIRESAGFSFVWRLEGEDSKGIDPPAVGKTYTATKPGVYAVRIVKKGGPMRCSRESAGLEIVEVDRPAVNFLIGGVNDAQKTSCVDIPIRFLPKVTFPNIASELSYTYEWDFGDQSEVLHEENVSHTYKKSNRYDVILSVGYEELDDCEGTRKKRVSISLAPKFEITRTPNVKEKCPQIEVALSAPSQIVVAGGQRSVHSYIWTSTEDISNETERVIRARKPATYTVVVENEQTKCTASSSVEIKNKNNSGIRLETDSQFIDSAKSSGSDTLYLKHVLERTQIPLTILNVRGQNSQNVLSWSRIEGIDQSDKIKPVLTAYYDPGLISPYLYVVKAVDNSGCEEEAYLSIPIQPDPLPEGDKLFSPNGDGIGDRWMLHKVELNDEACDLHIYDKRGKKILTQLRVSRNWRGWDGTFNGRELSQDVYYYVVECACTGQANCPRRNSGSILLYK